MSNLFKAPIRRIISNTIRLNSYALQRFYSQNICLHISFIKQGQLLRKKSNFL